VVRSGARDVENEGPDSVAGGQVIESYWGCRSELHILTVDLTLLQSPSEMIVDIW